ncbi:MAG: FeoB small GTPase domain-containing protein [Dehalococcoidales bacterium]|nr:FeoB small GTPase domain-containing protein [Dehalococcoidales bacterium]
MQKIRDFLSIGKRSQSCHGEGLSIAGDGLKRVAIVGTPNVGKSVIFNCLTGAYVTVSNYPGTTVNVSRGKAKIQSEEFEVMDTPGMYSLMPITEEERVARTMLLAEKLEVILHVVDARNLDRMLPFTLQLIEAGLPTMLDLNMMDEAEAAGIEININKLEQELGIPVVGTVATNGRGLETLRKRLVEYVRNQNCTEVR